MAVILGRAGLFACHNLQYLIAVYGLPLHQGFAHGFHFVAVFIQDFVGDLVLLVQNTADFRIDVLLRFFGNVLRTGYAATQEYFTFVFRINHHAHFVAHTVARYHFAGHLGGAFEIVGCAGGDASDEDVFGNASAEQNRQLAQHLVFIHADTVAFGKLPGQAQSPSARHNGYFMYGIGKRQAFGNNRMSGLMIGCCAFLVFVHDHAASFGTHVDFVFGIFKVALINLDFVVPSGK